MGWRHSCPSCSSAWGTRCCEAWLMQRHVSRDLFDDGCVGDKQSAEQLRNLFRVHVRDDAAAAKVWRATL